MRTHTRAQPHTRTVRCCLLRWLQVLREQLSVSACPMEEDTQTHTHTLLCVQNTQHLTCETILSANVRRSPGHRDIYSKLYSVWGSIINTDTDLEVNIGGFIFQQFVSLRRSREWTVSSISWRVFLQICVFHSSVKWRKTWRQRVEAFQVSCSAV